MIKQIIPEFSLGAQMIKLKLDIVLRPSAFNESIIMRKVEGKERRQSAVVIMGSR